MVEKEAEQSRKNIKIETQKLIDENNKYIRISQLFNFGEDSGRNKDYNSVIKYNLEIIKLYGDIENIKDKNHINNYAGAFYNIGTAKYELKIYDEAIEYLNKAIELNPYHSEAYNNLGLVYYAIKEYDKSLNYFNYSLSLNNKDPKTYNNRGTCKEKLEDYKGALEDYNKAIELNPNYSEFYNNRGNTHRILNNIENSIEDFDKAIELNPNNSEAYNNRGILRRQLKYYEEALKDYDKAIELNPNKAEFYNNRGVLIKDFKKVNYPFGAFSDFDKAIKLKPDYAEAYNNRGLLKLQIGILDNVIEDFDKAIELNHNYSEAYFNRYIAKSLLLSKITDKTLEEHKKSFEDAYNDLDTAYNLADEQLKAMIKEKVISMAILDNEVAKKFCEYKGWDIKDIIIYFTRYISKSSLLSKREYKDAEEYKKSFEDAYNDLDTAYNLADEQLKEIIKNQIIIMVKQGNEVAGKFCEDKGWDIK
ncbi:tetratricopeptide repeat protein [Brachyspira pulli]|uniref:tetratricopeptide repeat protein n=1 Tax=Brachyspira pulli TaxID=310721 RepID=UPI003007C66A